jgi:secondary thiamine-phosphate synthase enzyme
VDGSAGTARLGQYHGESRGGAQGKWGAGGTGAGQCDAHHCVFINDDESGLHEDYAAWLEKLAPHEPVVGYRHNRTGEDNADAHMKRQIMGREVVVAVTGGELDFGPWEQIFYGEFDGRRRKRVLIKIVGELGTWCARRAIHHTDSRSIGFCTASPLGMLPSWPT